MTLVNWKGNHKKMRAANDKWCFRARRNIWRRIRLKKFQKPENVRFVWIWLVVAIAISIESLCHPVIYRPFRAHLLLHSCSCYPRRYTNADSHHIPFFSFFILKSPRRFESGQGQGRCRNNNNKQQQQQPRQFERLLSFRLDIGCVVPHVE